MHSTRASSDAFGIVRRQLMVLALLGSAVWVLQVCQQRSVDRGLESQRNHETQAVTAYCCRSAALLSRALLGDRTVKNSESIIKNNIAVSTKPLTVSASEKKVDIKSVQSGNVDKMGFLPVTVDAVSDGRPCKLQFKYGVDSIKNGSSAKLPVAVAVVMDRVN